MVTCLFKTKIKTAVKRIIELKIAVAEYAVFVVVITHNLLESD